MMDFNSFRDMVTGQVPFIIIILWIVLLYLIKKTEMSLSIEKSDVSHYMTVLYLTLSFSVCL